LLLTDYVFLTSILKPSAAAIGIIQHYHLHARLKVAGHHATDAPSEATHALLSLPLPLPHGCYVFIIAAV
jgi:hypothetical protein